MQEKVKHNKQKMTETRLQPEEASMQTAEEQGERPQKLHKSGPSSPDVGVALSGNKTFSQDLSTLPRHVVSDSAEGLASFKCPSLEFTVLAKFGRARRGRLRLPHAEVQTPAFMPVGTHGTIKMIPCEIMETLGAKLILGNTYHLGSRVGKEEMGRVGGLHKFMGWGNNLLTDSGGFQMVSLLALAEITEEGVRFQNPATKEMLMLTPEESMRIQNAIGADVMMALDDVVSAVHPTRERFEEAVGRTTRWIDRCIQAHSRVQDQSLWGIVQGGLEEDLRLESMRQISARELPGYAIGGLSGGESKQQFWRMAEICSRDTNESLPVHKSRYIMGVGYPLDVVVCWTLGCDLCDCVYPTRTARFGTALTDYGTMRLKKAEYLDDARPIDEECDCTCCTQFSRAYVHATLNKQPVSHALLTEHNLRYMHRLGERFRHHVEQGTLVDFLQLFLNRMFPPAATAPPKWVRDALVMGAGIHEADQWYAWPTIDEEPAPEVEEPKDSVPPSKKGDKKKKSKRRKPEEGREQDEEQTGKPDEDSTSAESIQRE